MSRKDPQFQACLRAERKNMRKLFMFFPIREMLSHTIASLRQKHLLFQPFYYIFGLKCKKQMKKNWKKC